jgi:membrane fusion protein (multidrug efflux system)
VLRSILAILVVLLVGSAAAGAYWQFVALPAQQQKQQAGPGGRGGGGPVAVEAVPVKLAPAERTVEAVGTLLSNERVTIRPEVAGRIVAFDLVEGGRVEKGQVLVELEASVERAALADAEARRLLALSNLERARELRRTNVGTQRALDEAEAGARIAEAAVELAKAQLAKRSIKAPFDAKAGLRGISVGEFVAAGTALFALEQIDPIKVDFRIPELFLPAVRVGNEIKISIDAFADRAFAGRVTAIDPLVDERGRSLLVRAAIPNADEALRPGLFARVSLTLSVKPEALWVAEEALVPMGGKQYVFKVVDPGGGQPKTVARAEVTTGLRRPGEVELTSGVAAGDLVVVAGVTKVREGAPVVLQAPGGGRPPAAPAAPTARGAGDAPARQG